MRIFLSATIAPSSRERALYTWLRAAVPTGVACARERARRVEAGGGGGRGGGGGQGERVKRAHALVLRGPTGRQPAACAPEAKSVRRCARRRASPAAARAPARRRPHDGTLGAIARSRPRPASAHPYVPSPICSSFSKASTLRVATPNGGCVAGAARGVRSATIVQADGAQRGDDNHAQGRSCRRATAGWLASSATQGAGKWRARAGSSPCKADTRPRMAGARAFELPPKPR